MNEITCYNCEEEFKVESVYETEAEVCFCPFCGSELDIEDLDDLDIDEDTDEDYRN